MSGGSAARKSQGLDLAASSAVCKGLDAIKASMSGTRVVQVASTLLMHGADYLKTLLGSLEHWLRHHDSENPDHLGGSMSLRNCSSLTAFERAD